MAALSQVRNVNPLSGAEEGPRRADSIPSVPASLAIALGLSAALFVISQRNFLLFHGLAELASIAVGWAVFMLVWNARAFLADDALVFLGIASLFIGLVDLLHTLAYKGMGIFDPGWGANLATQLWIAGRGMEAVSWLVFPLLFGRRLRRGLVVSAYAGVRLTF